MNNLDKTWEDLQKQWDMAAETKYYRDYIAQGYNEEEAFREVGRNCVYKFISILSEYDINLRGKCLLELGCGSGRMTEFLAQEANYVYAMDISVKMIKRFKQRLGNIKNVKTIGGANNLKIFATNSIDIILSDLVFQHNPEIIVKKFIEGAWRILTPNGYLIFQIPIRTKHLVVLQKSGAIDMVYWTAKEINNLANKYFYKIIRKPKKGSHYVIFKKKYI